MGREAKLKVVRGQAPAKALVSVTLEPVEFHELSAASAQAEVATIRAQGAMAAAQAARQAERALLDALTKKYPGLSPDAPYSFDKKTFSLVPA